MIDYRLDMMRKKLFPPLLYLLLGLFAVGWREKRVQEQAGELLEAAREFVGAVEE